MSKSLGNGIDPFDVIDKYGTDSLRYALATGGTPGLDINFSFNKVETSHNFLNKVWNASRYILSLIDDDFKPVELTKDNLSYLDMWILSEFDKLLDSVKTNMDKYELGQAADYLYSFVYDEFCSDYLEYTKVTLASNDIKAKNVTLTVLSDILKNVLIMLFPFAPFISEEIYSKLPHSKKSVYEEKYPNQYGFTYDDKMLDLAKSLKESIRVIRNHKSEIGLAPNAPIEINYYGDENYLNLIKPYLMRFSFAKQINTLSEKNDDLTYFGCYALQLVEEETEESKNRKAKRIEFLKNEIMRSEKMLSNPNFLAKAKPEKVEEEKIKFEKYKEELTKYTK